MCCAVGAVAHAPWGCLVGVGSSASPWRPCPGRPPRPDPAGRSEERCRIQLCGARGLGLAPHGKGHEPAHPTPRCREPGGEGRRPGPATPREGGGEGREGVQTCTWLGEGS